MKKIYLLATLLALLISGCKEDIDTSARYVFSTRTIASYLESHEQFSEYVRLLKEQRISTLSESTVYQLLTAYGSYTCFAPTNLPSLFAYLKDVPHIRASMAGYFGVDPQKWDEVMRAYSPVFDSMGRVASIVAVDFSKSWYDEKISPMIFSEAIL